MSDHVATVTSRSHDYEIHVGLGVLDALGAHVRRVSGEGGSVALVTDTTVAALHAPRAAAAIVGSGLRIAATIALEPGESSKTLAGAGFVFDRLAAAGADRGTVVVAIGGGVVSDLAGFVAATWSRGAPWIAAPTTLLAQVDAAIGGKTGVDLPSGKNLVGAFHPPRAVIVDLATLATLDDSELRSGCGELLKYAMLAGDASLTRLAGLDVAAFRALHPEAIRAIRDAIAAKADLCSRDEFDRGDRRVLNLGHTIGHALETALDHRGLRHGEAVAIGLVAEARLARTVAGAHPDFVAKIAQVALALGLPVRVTPSVAGPAARDRALQALALDKKRDARSIVFALPIAPGEARIVALDPVAAAPAIRDSLTAAFGMESDGSAIES